MAVIETYSVSGIHCGHTCTKDGKSGLPGHETKFHAKRDDWGNRSGTPTYRVYRTEVASSSTSNPDYPWSSSYSPSTPRTYDPKDLNKDGIVSAQERQFYEANTQDTSASSPYVPTPEEEIAMIKAGSAPKTYAPADLNKDGKVTTQERQFWEANNWDAPSPITEPEQPPVKPTTNIEPTDTRTQSQKEADFFAALKEATDAAAAGDPTKLKNFDNFFNITRPSEEYTKSFYEYGGTKFTLVRGDGPISGDDGGANIGNGAAVYAINDRGERFHITSDAAKEMRANGTWTEPKIVNQQNLDAKTLRYDINSAQDLRGVNSKEIAGGYMLIRGNGPTSTESWTDENGFIGSGVPVLAIDKQGNATHVTSEYAKELQSSGGWVNPDVVDQKVIDAILKSTGGEPKKKLIAGGKSVAFDWQPEPKPSPQPVATASTPATRGGSTSPNETKKSDPAKKPDEELPEEEKKLLKDFHEHMERLGLGFNADGSIDFSGTKGQDPDEVHALHEEYDALTPNEKKILAATYDPDMEGAGSLPMEPEVELSGSLAVEPEELDEVGKGALPGSSGEVRTQSDNPQAIEARKAAIESRLERIAAQRQPWKNGPAKIADGTSDMVPPPIAGGAAKNNGLPTQQ